MKQSSHPVTMFVVLLVAAVISTASVRAGGSPGAVVVQSAAPQTQPVKIVPVPGQPNRLQIVKEPAVTPRLVVVDIVDQAAPTPGRIVPLRVTIVLSKFQGEKRISNLPYTLLVNSVGNINLRMGSDVPVPTTTVGAGGSTPVVQSFQYRSVGTNIDCKALGQNAEGRYSLDLAVEDSSVHNDVAAGAPNRPAATFQSFRVTTNVVLADGQTAQFTTATDKVTGEVMKVDVTLNVVK